MNPLTKRTSVILALALGASLLVACGTPASAQSTSVPERTITVTGNDSAFGSPDIATIQIGVQSRNEDPSAAVNAANERMNAILATLKAAGVEDKDIQTTNFSISSQQDYDPLTGQPREMIVFVVDNTLSVTVRDLAKLGATLSSVVDAGANNIYGVSFSVSDAAKLESEARTRAVADARARAEELAQAAGVTLGEVVSISEFTSGPIPYAVAEARQGVGGGGAVPIATGQYQLNLQVNVAFSIR